MNANARPAAPCERLFVYGTLRRGLRLHHHLVRLGASFQSDARVAGELFDLGSYPGACAANGGGRWVRGEVFRLRQPAQDLEVLDRVEEFMPSNPERSEFVRALEEVLLTNNERQSAWIYWLGPDAASRRRRIACGDYAEWLAKIGVGLREV